MINFKAMGKRVREARKDKGLTQEKFAELVDIATEYASRIETGSSRPSLVLIEKIAFVLDIDEAEIMFGKESEDQEARELINKIFSMNPKKRLAAERIIDAISEL